VSGDFDAAAFGVHLKELRTLRRMSLEEVGKAAGFTKSHVWELETGRARNPTVRAVWSLARALGVTPAALLGLNDQTLALDPTAMEVACLVDRALRDARKEWVREFVSLPTPAQTASGVEG
jgi:transcriptional regulator with XRE-family HTH domain